jgi:hypothetical protein
MRNDDVLYCDLLLEKLCNQPARLITILLAAYQILTLIAIAEITDSFTK